MKSNRIILITRNQLDTCHIRFVVFLALQSVLRVAKDGFSSLIHCNMSYELYIYIYLYIQSLHHSSVLYEFQAKSNIIVNELHWLDSEFHKALRGGNRSGSSRDQSSRVVIADYRAVSAREDLAWSSIPVILSFHRCSVTVVRDNGKMFPKTCVHIQSRRKHEESSGMQWLSGKTCICTVGEKMWTSKFKFIKRNLNIKDFYFLKPLYYL